MRKKSSSRTTATPHADPPARWMAPGSEPGTGRLNRLPEESQWTEITSSSGEITSNRCSSSEAVAITASYTTQPSIPPRRIVAPVRSHCTDRLNPEEAACCLQLGVEAEAIQFFSPKEAWELRASALSVFMLVASVSCSDSEGNYGGHCFC